ncbi:hypothetical protein [Nocardia higoensis]|nr:hypothetical protein [Nocardia higoensis]
MTETVVIEAGEAPRRVVREAARDAIEQAGTGAAQSSAIDMNQAA